VDVLYDLAKVVVRFIDSSPGLPLSLLYVLVASVRPSGARRTARRARRPVDAAEVDGGVAGGPVMTS
jgi:hypothetical protein